MIFRFYIAISVLATSATPHLAQEILVSCQLIANVMSKVILCLSVSISSMASTKIVKFTNPNISGKPLHTQDHEGIKCP